MADYLQMYATLCVAVDRVIKPLEEIPAAKVYAQRLCAAMEEAEEIYIATSKNEDPRKE